VSTRHNVTVFLALCGNSLPSLSVLFSTVTTEAGVAVRKDGLVRLGEWQRRFGRTNQFPTQSLLVCPCRNETGRKSLRLLSSSTAVAQNHRIFDNERVPVSQPVVR
jgi:hypothetical protein